MKKLIRKLLGGLLPPTMPVPFGNPSDDMIEVIKIYKGENSQTLGFVPIELIALVKDDQIEFVAEGYGIERYIADYKEI